MFNLSDRDAKIILVLLIVCVIALPYVFYSKATREDTDIQKAKNIQLQERYDQLQAMNEHREEYIAETKRLDEKRDEIIASFPADILPENTTMYLHNLEQESLVIRDKNMDQIAEDGLPEDMDLSMLGIYGNTILWFDTVAFGQNDILPISEEDTEDSIKGIVNDTSVTYQCFYDGLKYMLQDMLDNSDPMIYRTMDVAYDEGTGQLTGSLMLEQYAISGPGRTIAQAQTTPDNYGHEIIHGNLPYGIFGALDEATAFDRRVKLLNRMMVMEEAGQMDLNGLGDELVAPEAGEEQTQTQ